MGRSVIFYTRRGWPVTSGTVGATGVLTLAVTFMESNPHPSGTAVAGALLVGMASRLRYLASQPLGSSATAKTSERPKVLLPPP